MISFNGNLRLKVTLDFGRLKKEKIHRDPMTHNSSS